MSEIHQHCFNVYVRVEAISGKILGARISDEEIDHRLFNEDTEEWMPLNERTPWWQHDLDAAAYLSDVLDFPETIAELYRDNLDSTDTLDACEVTDRIADKLIGWGHDLEPHEHTILPIPGQYEVLDGGLALYFACACGRKFTTSVDCDEMEECK